MSCASALASDLLPTNGGKAGPENRGRRQGRQPLNKEEKNCLTFFFPLYLFFIQRMVPSLPPLLGSPWGIHSIRILEERFVKQECFLILTY